MLFKRYIGVAGIILSGCATYQPPNLPPEQRAVIAPPAARKGNTLSISKIDGLAPTTASSLLFAGSSDPVTLAPGKHTLRIETSFGYTRGFIDLWIVCEAGKTYRIEQSTDGYSFTAWFVEAATGLRVGGVVGSSDEPPS